MKSVAKVIYPKSFFALCFLLVAFPTSLWCLNQTKLIFQIPEIVFSELNKYRRVIYTHEKDRIKYTKEEVSEWPQSEDTIWNPNGWQIPNEKGLVQLSYLTPQKMEMDREDILFQESWGFASFGVGIGVGGLISVDLDGDGIKEIICAASSIDFFPATYWYILKYSPEFQEYQIHWVSPQNRNYIVDISVHEINGINKIFVCERITRIVHIYDGLTLIEDASFVHNGELINKLTIVDADNDSVDEIVICDDENIILYNLEDFSEKSVIPYGGYDFEVGNIDQDPAKEIILNSGIVLEHTLDTTIVKWNYPATFGYIVELSDIDADNMQEIICAYSWYYIKAFDADQQIEKWQINPELDIGGLLLYDIDFDGVEEVIYGDDQSGEIHCHDAITLEEEWNIYDMASGVTDIIISDLDDDGELEVIWGVGNTSTGPDYLNIYQVTDQSQVWKSPNYSGGFKAFAVDDIDLDGVNELVTASHGNQAFYPPLDAVLFVFDAETHELEWQSGDSFFPEYFVRINDLKLADINFDGNKEIIACGNGYFEDGGTEAVIYIIDGVTHEIISTIHPGLSNATFHDVIISDIDDDGEHEIITTSNNHPDWGGYILIINSQSGDIEWQTRGFGRNTSRINTLSVSDIDNDNVKEIVAISDSIFVIDGISHEIVISSFGGALGLDLNDLNNDGTMDLLVGTEDNTILQLDGNTLAIAETHEVNANNVHALKIFDIDGNGLKEFIFSDDEFFYAYSPTTSSIVWQSQSYGYSPGYHNRMIVADYDTDGRVELLSYASLGIYEFEGPVMVTIAEEKYNNLQIPVQNNLYQNYPNPFNPVTTIDYDIHKQMNVLVQIYDIKGSLVTTLVDERQYRGYYSIEWTGVDQHGLSVPSGIYLYRIVAEDYSEVMKMTLIK